MTTSGGASRQKFLREQLELSGEDQNGRETLSNIDYMVGGTVPGPELRGPPLVAPYVLASLVEKQEETLEVQPNGSGFGEVATRTGLGGGSTAQSVTLTRNGDPPEGESSLRGDVHESGRDRTARKGRSFMHKDERLMRNAVLLLAFLGIVAFISLGVAGQHGPTGAAIGFIVATILLLVGVSFFLVRTAQVSARARNRQRREL